MGAVLPFKRRDPVRSDLFHRAAIRVARSVFLRASEAGDKAVARSAWFRFTQLLNRRNAG